MSNYEVIVGNIGTVLKTNNPIEARRTYGIYKKQSEEDYGRAGGEDVTIMKDDEVEVEFFGSISESFMEEDS